MPTKRALAVIAAAALVVPLAFVSSPAARVPSFTFGSAVIVDPIHMFGEPDVRISPRGNVYVSGPWGTGTQRSLWEWSSDGGRTFRPLHSSPITNVNGSDTTITGPGGGDTEITIGRNDKVYYADLAALLTLKVATFDPKTRSMSTKTLTNIQDTENQYDRQWFALWDPKDPTAVRKTTGYTGPFPVNYMVWLGSGEPSSYSFDGIHYPTSQMSVPIANDGPLVIDQATGTVIQSISVKDTTDVGIALRWRDPSKPSDPALRKWKMIKIASMPAGTTSDADWPIVAIDESRTAYVVWTTKSAKTSSQDPNAWQIWYSYAPAAGGWAHWSKPLRISTPPARTNVMPWTVAGSKGRLAAVWYGTNDATHDPGATDVHQAWDVFAAMVTNADTPHPTVEQVKVTRHPMHYGTICFNGLGCIQQRGNRNLADFFEVSVDPRDGALAIVYDDTSNELVQTIPGTDTPIPAPIEGTADHRGGAVVTLMRQNGGIGLFGTPIAGASAFGSARLAGAKGDAMFDPVYGGTQVPALDTQGLTMTKDGNDLVFRMAITSLNDTAGAIRATGAGALDYIVRWIGDPIDSPTGERYPIYYAAAEMTITGTPTFFAGTARSIDLCSVSACDPHTLEYPAPPYGGTAVTGRLIHGIGGAPDAWEIRVPRDAVGGPTDSTLFESLSAYTIARNKPASLPVTNAEEQAGISPVVVDALCCVDTTLNAASPVVLATKTTRPATTPASKPASRGSRLAATGVGSAPLWVVIALIAGAALMRRALRRT